MHAVAYCLVVKTLEDSVDSDSDGPMYHIASYDARRSCYSLCPCYTLDMDKDTLPLAWLQLCDDRQPSPNYVATYMSLETIIQVKPVKTSYTSEKPVKPGKTS